MMTAGRYARFIARSVVHECFFQFISLSQTEDLKVVEPGRSRRSNALLVIRITAAFWTPLLVVLQLRQLLEEALNALEGGECVRGVRVGGRFCKYVQVDVWRAAVPVNIQVTRSTMRLVHKNQRRRELFGLAQQVSLLKKR